MMVLYWKQFGKGKQNLVLLHGWGLNSTVWTNIEAECYSYFRVHFIDLPGYGNNNCFPPMSLQEITEIIWEKAPRKAIWLGWSLGALIATFIALNHQTEIDSLITVASSPCFCQKVNWPGISSMVLRGFKKELQDNLYRTIERFLVLQTLGAKTAYKDIRLLREVLYKQKLPLIPVLKEGLEVLQETDLRRSLLALNKPFLRIYGEFDRLVPVKIASIIDRWLPSSPSLIIKNAAHVPFISHPNLLVQLLIDFVNYKENIKSKDKFLMRIQ